LIAMDGLNLTADEVLARVPHGRGALLLGGALLEPRRSVTCEVRLSGSEGCFAGHYPGAPILPASTLIEMFAQAGAILCADDRPAGVAGLLVGVEALRVRLPTVPPAAVTIVVRLRERRGPVVWLDCSASHEGGRQAACGTLVVTLGGTER
jgi:3-hydroxymyristoyl/3-hydroxydecanoyl-(acyl carrier protein) dehydratase